jgi:hypothetical protein
MDVSDDTKDLLPNNIQQAELYFLESDRLTKSGRMKITDREDFITEEFTFFHRDLHGSRFP